MKPLLAIVEILGALAVAAVGVFVLYWAGMRIAVEIAVRLGFNG